MQGSFEVSRGMNVSKESDAAFLKQLQEYDPPRYHRLQTNILKDYPRAKAEKENPQ